MVSLLIALAGGVGAAARFVADGAITHRSRATLPVATLIINVTGSFLLGVVSGWALGSGPSPLTAILGIGLLGGFTTFSTASVELVGLVRTERPRAALALAVSMLVLSLTAGVIGIVLARWALT